MPSSSEYSRELVRVSVANAALAFGVQQAAPEVIDCLADVVQNYIHSIGKAANELCESSGRNAPGIQDVIEAINIVSKGKEKWSDLKDFAKPSSSAAVGWDQSFPHEVNTFPEKSKSSNNKLNDKRVNSKKPYIPSHLPSFPATHTTKQSKQKRKSTDLGNTDKESKQMRA